MTGPHTLWRLAAALRIAHHVPGRVRLKLAGAPLAELAALAGDVRALQAALAAAPGVRTVRVNAAAASCTVEYDPARIPPAAWADLVTGQRSADARALLDLVATGTGR